MAKNFLLAQKSELDPSIPSPSPHSLQKSGWLTMSFDIVLLLPCGIEERTLGNIGTKAFCQRDQKQPFHCVAGQDPKALAPLIARYTGWVMWTISLEAGATPSWHE